MGSLTDRLDYLAETKGYIRQSIENKGQVIEDTDTFRDYAKKISNITSKIEFNNTGTMKGDMLINATDVKITSTIMPIIKSSTGFVIEDNGSLTINDATVRLIGTLNGKVKLYLDVATPGESIVRIEAIPNEGYILSTIFVNDMEIQGYTFTMPYEYDTYNVQVIFETGDEARIYERVAERYTTLDFITAMPDEAYIETDIFGLNTANTKIVTEFKTGLGEDKTASSGIFGTRAAASVTENYSLMRMASLSSSKMIQIRYTNGGYLTNLVDNDDDFMVATIQNDNFYLDDQIAVATTKPFKTTFPLHLFSVNTGGEPSNLKGYRSIRYLKIYENTILKHYFIPILDDDGIACMCDGLTMKLYHSANEFEFDPAMKRPKMIL